MRILFVLVGLALSTPALGQTNGASPRLGMPYNDAAGIVGAPYYDAAGVVPLRDYLLGLLMERERQGQQRFEAQEKALSLALDATKTAIAADFQLKLQDQNLRFVEKAAAKETFDALEGKVDALDRRLDDMRAASEGSISLWNLLLAAFGAATLAFSVIWPMIPTRGRGAR